MFPPARRPLAIAILVAGAFFMENLDGTVIATAMPQMARSFGASPVDVNIGMTAYLLALAVFIPMSGWLADRFGAKPVFASAIGLFTASSVLCGLSNGLWEFTAARILQGLGGAMMVPVGRLVVLRATQSRIYCVQLPISLGLGWQHPYWARPSVVSSPPTLLGVGSSS
jgi:MFS family permease